MAGRKAPRIHRVPKRRKSKQASSANPSADSPSSQRANRGVSFKTQLGRDQVRAAGQLLSAHEARFAYLSVPCRVFSSYHEHNIPGFGKLKGRDNSVVFLRNMTLKDYSPSQPAYLESLRSGCTLRFHRSRRLRQNRPQTLHCRVQNRSRLLSLGKHSKGVQCIRTCKARAHAAVVQDGF